MSSHNFKEKDRIKVYATLNGSVAESKGVITRFRPDGMLYVNLDGRRGEIVAHPKQCRRLKPAKRAEFYLSNAQVFELLKQNGKESSQIYIYKTIPGLATTGWIKFREVKEK